MPEALLAAGLAETIGARRAGRVEPPPYVPGLDPQTQVTNAPGLREYAFRLADAVGDVLGRGEFRVVLGGDCSILLGSLLGAARHGRHGVVFIDGHIDFYRRKTPSGMAARRTATWRCRRPWAGRPHRFRHRATASARR
jgi:arginase